MFTFLTFTLPSHFSGAKPNIIILFPLSSLTDFERLKYLLLFFRIRIVTCVISATVNDNIFRVFFYVGLACQCMWLLFGPLKDFTTNFCFSFEISNRFKSLTIESPTLSYFFTGCWVYGGGLLDLLIIYFTRVGFGWLAILLWF